MFQARKALIVGGGGFLGRNVVNVFKENWKVCSVDFSANEEADQSIVLTSESSALEHAQKILEEIPQGTRFDAILCLAGGWIGGGIQAPEIFKSLDFMYKVCILPPVITGHVAASTISDEGLLVFTGAAAPFLQTTPDMMAYGIAKTATHSLALNMAERKEIPSTSTVVTILPEVIDTPANRENMPEADHSKWASPKGIGSLIKMWAEGNNRPENGSFAVLKVINGQVSPDFV